MFLFGKYAVGVSRCLFVLTVWFCSGVYDFSAVEGFRVPRSCGLCEALPAWPLSDRGALNPKPKPRAAVLAMQVAKLFNSIFRGKRLVRGLKRILLLRHS